MIPNIAGISQIVIKDPPTCRKFQGRVTSHRCAEVARARERCEDYVRYFSSMLNILKKDHGFRSTS